MATLSISVKRDAGIQDFRITVDTKSVSTREDGGGIAKGQIEVSDGPHVLLYFCAGEKGAQLTITGKVGSTIVINHIGNVRKSKPIGHGDVPFTV